MSTAPIPPPAKRPKRKSPPVVVVSVLTPIRTVSESNSHAHWRERQQRAKRQRNNASMWLCITCPGRPSLPVTITLTRLSVRKLDDDNLQSALKHVRDGVADYFRTDDGDPRYTWKYRQEKSKVVGVRIEVSAPRPFAGAAQASRRRPLAGFAKGTFDMRDDFNGPLEFFDKSGGAR